MRTYFNRALTLTLCFWLSAAALPALAHTGQGQTNKPKAGSETNCDGVLEVIPTKQMTFIRKRRPAARAQQPTGVRPKTKETGDTKPEQRPGENASKEKRGA